MTEFKSTTEALASIRRWIENNWYLDASSALDGKCVSVNGVPTEIICKRSQPVRLVPAFVDIRTNHRDEPDLEFDIPRVEIKIEVTVKPCAKQYEGYVSHCSARHVEDPFDRGIFREEIREML